MDRLSQSTWKLGLGKLSLMGNYYNHRERRHGHLTNVLGGVFVGPYGPGSHMDNGGTGPILWF